MEYIFLALTIIVIFIITLLYQKLIISKKPILFKILPLLLFISIPLWFFLNPKESSENTDIIQPIEKLIESVVGKKGNESSELENIVQDELKNVDGTYAIAIKNLETNESYFYNENRIFTTASLYKLWYMGETFNQIEKGKLILDQTISRSAEELNKIFDIDEEFAEIKKGNVTYKIEDAIEKMITVSDNYAAHLLGVTIGISNVKQLLAENRLDDSRIDISPPLTTAKDILSFYEKLYNGKIVSRSASNEMLSVLKRQTLNDRIPKYLPKNIKVAHKTGELGAIKHDAGIVFSENGDYIIVLLSETKSQATAAETEAKISERVWEYFN